MSESQRDDLPFELGVRTRTRAPDWLHRRFRPVATEPQPPNSQTRVFVAALAIFLLSYLLLNSLVNHAYIGDDTDQIFFSQRFALGYHEQPPLYTWVVWLVFKLCGASRFAYALVKTSIIGGVCGTLFATGCEVFRDRRKAMLVAFAPLLIPNFAWNAVAYLTHTNLACLFTIATLLALVRVQKFGNTRDYVLLGVVVGLGLLSKYNFAIFAAGLLGSAISLPAFRLRLCDRRFLLTGLLVMVIATPHMQWMCEHWSEIAHAGQIKAKLTKEHPAAVRIGFGLTQLSLNLLLVLGPMLVAFAALQWKSASGVVRVVRSAPSEVEKLLSRFFLMTGVACVTLIIGFRAAHVHERWLQPLALLVPFWLLARCDGEQFHNTRLKWLDRLLAASALAILIGWGAQLVGNYHKFGEYHLKMSFKEASTAIARILKQGSVVVSEDRVLAANLSTLLPEAEHVCVAHPLFVSQVSDDRHVVLVWNLAHGKRQPPPLARTFIAKTLKRRIASGSQPRIVEIHDQGNGRSLARLAVVELVPLEPIELSSLDTNAH
jgi:4-amino-4-deoxy-L-arabinose transferase-like glycosyltransferase